MLILTLVLVLLFFLIYMRQRRMSILKRSGIPGPKPNLIFGHLFDIGFGGFKSVFPKWTEKYGPIVGFYLGGRPQVLVTDFDMIRHILVKDFYKFSNRNQCIPGGIHPTPQFQHMLIWSRDSVWRNLRASLSPSFSAYKLHAMEPLMMLTIDKSISELNDVAKSDQEFNIGPVMKELTFSTAAKCIFGLNFSLKELTQDTKSFIEITLPRLEKSILAMVMVLFPSLTFIAYPLRVLWERIRFYMTWSPEGACFEVTKQLVLLRQRSDLKVMNFLQLLLNAKRIQTIADSELEMSSDDVKPNDNLLNKELDSENISNDEIVANALLFLLASYETTSVTLQFCLHNLINHQSVQDKLRTQLRKTVDPGSKKISSSALSSIPLLNHIVKETLRMFPPAAPFTARVANENYEYQGIVIPKGAGVFIGVSAIHNDPKLWPEPEEFRPERFESDFDKLTYLPFGGGPRNCLGMRFAYMEIELALANLILNYRFEPGPSTEKKIKTMETFATLIPQNGVFCKVTRLEQ
ncbi:hypothetical protein HA402_006965 [Bradysia odoriphaga]|nr:hypothetical protein HA402_006965 [Bradysia odoriphaga]